MSKAEIIQAARREKRTLLSEIESKELLKEAKIPVVETRLATSKKEAMELAAKMGFPVVMKIVSPDISHKSDVGGVKLGIQNATQAGKA
ncbi:MAG: acetate--CoA ligase family protein, partial [Dehalococcoidia bacterium]